MCKKVCCYDCIHCYQNTDEETGTEFLGVYTCDNDQTITMVEDEARTEFDYEELNCFESEE